MLFTIKRPTSRRFFQLSIGSLGLGNRSKAKQFIKICLMFFTSLYVYVWRKIRFLWDLLTRLLFFVYQLPSIVKSFVVKKLIWSRGRLGRSLATGVVLIVALIIFTVGELFNSSKLVVDQPVNSDYLVSTTDIIPKKEIALTVIPDARRTESISYVIESGDTLYKIGNKFKISVDALEYVNNLNDNSVLTVGTSVSIPPVAGLIHKVESGDTLASIANKYSVPPQAIADFNYILDTSKLAVGSELVIPGGKVPQAPPTPVYIPPVGTSNGPIAQAAPSKDLCVWPTTVHIITQPFSWYHNGVDIATPLAGGMPPIFACSGGTVIRAGWDPFGLGLHVRIDHGNGYVSIYGHMSKLDVSYGQKVSRGQIIGIMGSTGNSTGPHVHFMVEYNGKPQNPLNFAN